MNIPRISSGLASSALALGLCATAAAQTADAETSPPTRVKAPVAQQAHPTVASSPNLPARASRLIGTEVFYASGAELSSIHDLVVSATGQVIAILERPDARIVAVPLGSLVPRLKDDGEDEEHMSKSRTPHVERFAFQCERSVCDSAPTAKDVGSIDGGWLARSAKHFAPVTTPAPPADQEPAASTRVAVARAPVFLASLMGQPLETSEGVALGEIDDVAIDLGTGMVSYVIVSTGGLVGIGASLRAIGFDAITMNAGSMSIMMTKDSFSKLPGLDLDRLPVNPVGALAMRSDPGSTVADRNQRSN
jgi:sporulation protein YlmC with PRC-barrel domain